MSKAITVSIVDDHPALIDGLKVLLQNNTALEITHCFSSSNAFMEAYKLDPTDLVILDIHMHEKDGFECAQWIREVHPAAKIIIYSMFMENSMIAKALKIGVDAYVDKSTPNELLLEKINEVLSGQKQTFQNLELRKLSTKKLSNREREIALLLLEGKRAETISELLFISLLTVRTHIRNIHTKLSVTNSHELASLLADNPGLLGI